MVEITADDILVGEISGQGTLLATVSMYGSIKRDEEGSQKEKPGDDT